MTCQQCFGFNEQHGYCSVIKSVLWSEHMDSPAFWVENHILRLSAILIGLKSILRSYPPLSSLSSLSLFLYSQVFILVHMCVRKGVLDDWNLFHLSFRSAIWGRQLPQPLSPGTASPTKPSSENQQLQLHHFLLQGSQQQRWPALLPQEDTWWGKVFVCTAVPLGSLHICFEFHFYVTVLYNGSIYG